MLLCVDGLFSYVQENILESRVYVYARMRACICVQGGSIMDRIVEADSFSEVDAAYVCAVCLCVCSCVCVCVCMYVRTYVCLCVSVYV